MNISSITLPTLANTALVSTSMSTEVSVPPLNSLSRQPYYNALHISCSALNSSKRGDEMSASSYYRTPPDTSIHIKNCSIHHLSYSHPPKFDYAIRNHPYEISLSASSSFDFQSSNSVFGTASLRERRQRNKAASAKYRAKKNRQYGEMRSIISSLTKENDLLQNQLENAQQENRRLKTTYDKLRGKVVAEKMLKSLLNDRAHQIVDEQDCSDEEGFGSGEETFKSTHFSIEIKNSSNQVNFLQNNHL
ncbi:hypothetical protein G6F33_001516 [Rhizopus arrhizus]|nr:hypothetical protein G6F33_001516 [Rhizopus arrhizus]